MKNSWNEAVEKVKDYLNNSNKIIEKRTHLHNWWRKRILYIRNCIEIAYEKRKSIEKYHKYNCLELK